MDNNVIKTMQEHPEEVWLKVADLVGGIAQEHAKVFARLEFSTPDECPWNPCGCLWVVFSKDYEFSCRICAKADDTTRFRKAIEQITGEKIAVSFFVDASLPSRQYTQAESRYSVREPEPPKSRTNLRQPEIKWLAREKKDRLVDRLVVACPFCSTHTLAKQARDADSSLTVAFVCKSCGSVFGFTIEWDGAAWTYKQAAEESNDKCESPIEKMFWKAVQDIKLDLQPQVEVGKYRVDFGNLARKIGVEIDGHEYHKTKEQRTADAKRERDLRRLGWQIIRFTGSEVYRNATKCVREVADFLQ